DETDAKPLHSQRQHLYVRTGSRAIEAQLGALGGPEEDQQATESYGVRDHQSGKSTLTPVFLSPTTTGAGPRCLQGHGRSEDPTLRVAGLRGVRAKGRKNQSKYTWPRSCRSWPRSCSRGIISSPLIAPLIGSPLYRISFEGLTPHGCLAPDLQDYP